MKIITPQKIMNPLYHKKIAKFLFFIYNCLALLLYIHLYKYFFIPFLKTEIFHDIFKSSLNTDVLQLHKINSHSSGYIIQFLILLNGTRQIIANYFHCN